MIKPQYSDFQPVRLEDRDLIESYLRRAKRRNCELNFCNFYNWSEIYDYRFTTADGLLLVSLDGGDELLWPTGREVTPEEMAAVSEVMSQAGHHGSFIDIPDDYVAAHRLELEQYFALECNPDDWDYVYAVEKLFHLNGAKLRKKRNHISQFERNYSDWQIIELNPQNAGACIPFVEYLYRDAGMNELQQEDFAAITRAVHYFDHTGLAGLSLYAGGKMAAFAMFSRQNDDTYTVHFEKSDKEIVGSSQVINRATAEFLHGRCTYINREQDLGIQGLRHAKQSYDPDFQIVSYRLIRKN